MFAFVATDGCACLRWWTADGCVGAGLGKVVVVVSCCLVCVLDSWVDTGHIATVKHIDTVCSLRRVPCSGRRLVCSSMILIFLF